ncbi:MAG: AI-2E family transporter [Deltaproteobacteria bacterium]|nr:AI-2E family transporter [Deltaproteobacteria bacterium]MCB9785389.1 AI-2E family transporter [Deltaproteobacteria bacterium]
MADDQTTPPADPPATRDERPPADPPAPQPADAASTPPASVTARVTAASGDAQRPTGGDVITSTVTATANDAETAAATVAATAAATAAASMGAANLPWRKIAWSAALAGTFVLLIWLANRVPSASIPLLTAFVVAYLLDPVVDFFEARGIPRTPTILALMLLSLLVTAAVVLLLGPRILDELRQVPAKLRDALAHAQPWLEDKLGVSVPGSVSEAIDRFAGDQAAAKSLLAPAGSVARAVYGGTTSALGFIVALFTIPLFAFYLLRDFDRITARLDSLVPLQARPAVRARMREIDEALGAFVRGQMLVATILVVLYAIGFSIVGLPLAIVVAAISGFGNMIPYVGTAIGMILATLLVVLEWQGFGHLAAVYGVFAGVQALEGWVITPRVVGDSVGLSPLVVIVAILVFGELFGFIGVLIAVPLAAVVKILGRVAIEEYQSSTLFTDR